jgi:GNAT superfamily N-acetyltransferase
VCYEGNDPVGYAHYRFNYNRTAMYLTGSGVLASYRKKGIYRQLVTMRLQKAKEIGAAVVTTQARVGHSAPILEKLGFNIYETYIQLTRKAFTCR